MQLPWWPPSDTVLRPCTLCLTSPSIPPQGLCTCRAPREPPRVFSRLPPSLPRSSTVKHPPHLRETIFFIHREAICLPPEGGNSALRTSQQELVCWWWQGRHQDSQHRLHARAGIPRLAEQSVDGHLGSCCGSLLPSWRETLKQAEQTRSLQLLSPRVHDTEATCPHTEGQGHEVRAEDGQPRVLFSLVADGRRCWCPRSPVWGPGLARPWT